MPQDWFAQNAPKSAPQPPQQGDDWFAANAPTAQHPTDITSNPNNEGVYRMNGPKGPVGVPYSNVGAAKQAGLVLDQSDVLRYNKDAGSNPWRTQAGYLNSTTQHEPAPTTGLRSFSPTHLGQELVAGTADAIKSIPHMFDTGPDPFAGMTPEQRLQARADMVANQGEQQVRAFVADPGGSYAAHVGEQIPSAVAGAVGSKLVSTVAGKIAPSAVPGQNYTQAHAAAFEGLTAKANGMGPNFIPQNLTTDALSPIRQSAADMLANGTPEEQSIARNVTAPGVKPLDRLAAVHSVIQKSLSDLEAQHTPALAQVAQTPVDMTPIQRGLQAQIKPGMSAADIAGINDLIQRSGQITNLGDLNNFRQIMNEEASPSYRQTPTRAGQASAPQQITTDTANAVRGHYYDQLQQATGTDFQPLKAKQSQLLTTREAIERLQSPLSKEQADFNAPMTPRAVAGEIGDAAVNVVKNPKKLIQQQILRESHASSAAYLIRKALTDLPNATAPVVQSPSFGSSQAPGLIQANANPQVIQGTPINTSPQASPTLQLPPWLQNLLPQTASEGGVPAYRQPTPPPPVNPSTAVTRIAPTKFAPSPDVAPTLTRPVTPSGQVLTPLQRFLEAGDLEKSIESPSTDDLKRAISNIRRRKGK